MAASVYATPPPDLSGEDTALSDVSNSSQISSSSSSKATKRNLTSLLTGSGDSNVGVNNPIRTNSTSSSSASNVYDPSLLDQSKKRRKQTTPIRISALNLSIDPTLAAIGTEIPLTDSGTDDIQLNDSGTSDQDENVIENEKILISDDSQNDEILDENNRQVNQEMTNSETLLIEENGDKIDNEIVTTEIENKNNDNNQITYVISKKDSNEIVKSDIQISSPSIENENRVTKSPNLLINPMALLKTNISLTSIEEIKENIKSNSREPSPVIPPPPPQNAQQKIIKMENEKEIIQSIKTDILPENNVEKNPLKECEECKEKFDSDLKLSVHILQVHTVPKVHIIPKVQNLERRDYPLALPPQLLPQSSLPQATENDNDSRDVFDGSLPLKIKLENTSDYGNDSSPPSSGIVIDNGQHKLSGIGGGNMPRPEEWLSSMSGLGFPFPPEAAAAAALSATNYLSQLPLLGVPSVGGFTSVDGLSRPPLRIFNPEAYCDLCNKEFCNKYFLKTHKANKHGIYDPNISSSENIANNPLNQITQVLQMQFQQQQLEQQHHHQQQMQQVQQQPSSSQPPPPSSSTSSSQQPSGNQQQSSNQQQALMPPELTVFCDICNKRFTNIFAMKRHRSKAHEIPPPINSPNNLIKISQQQQQDLSPEHLNEKEIILTNNNTNTISTISSSSSSSSSSSLITTPATTITTIQSTAITNTQTTPPSTSTLLRMPDGFREDFTLEQEDVSFTPQPRKLSPSSSQQAREANFSYDKLKRLGVLNPEAFCDLCCKEYCNKYFLRTHKLKRHGIFMPNEDGCKDEKLPWPFMQQMQQLQMQMQTTPLNLMMAGEKLPRRLSDGILIGDGFKKIRLESNLNNNAANLPTDDGSLNGQNEKINDSGGGVSGIGIGSNTGKGFEMPENFNQMMLDGITNSSSHDPEPISIDLQKLQSMILQLNDLNGQRPVSCHFCGKDMENQYILQAHIVTEHSAENHSLLSSIGSGLVDGVLGGSGGGMKLSSHPSSPTNSNQTEICKQCDKEFAGLMELKQHIIEYHGLLLNSPLREGFVTPERSINIGGGGSGSTGPGTPNHMDRKQQFNVTPTSSYCEICNKELCNKYFMKTHMQRMHGIEIENGAQIGGVVCNICNKELCSKYFLRVHKNNSHGIVDEGSPLPQQPIRQLGSGTGGGGGGGSINDGVMTPESESIYQALENKQDLAELSTRYFTHYTEVCPLCSRRFRSAKWLRAHLMSDHGKAGTDKLRELEQHMSFGKSENSPTLKIPNGNTAPGIYMSGGSNSSGGGSSGGGVGMSLNNIDPNILAKSPFPGLFMNENSSVNSQQQQQQQQQQQRIKEYQCSMCPFSTPYYAFLFIHERSHSILSTNTNSIKSETAVSIAKEQQEQRIPDDTEHDNENDNENEHNIMLHNEQQQQKRQQQSSLSGTPPPTTTPASTPIPQTPQETANSNKLDDKISPNIDEPIKIKINNNSSNNISNYITNNINHNSLNELVNLTNRPASYAIPQNFDGELMQSFLIEEKHKTPITDENSTTSTNDDLMATASNRFVPAVVYLPVRERISGPITVSFTLTPA